MAVLVTGAFGRLGTEAISTLVEHGERAVAFDVPTRLNRWRARKIGPKVRVVWGDIRSIADVRSALEGCRAVIHNAGILAPASERAPALAREVNVEGTRNILTAIEAQSPTPILVYASTFSVCGPRAPGGPPLTAEDPAIGTDHYTSHKAACEDLICASGLPWVIFRIGVAVSAQARDYSPDVFRLLFEIDPRTRLEYVHPRDVALAEVRAMAAPEALRKILMIGGGESCRTTFKEFHGAIFEASGIGELPEQAYGDRPYYCDWVDTTESQALLRYQRHSFDDFIRELRHEMRWTRPVVRACAPWIRRFLLRYSEAWQKRERGA